MSNSWRQPFRHLRRGALLDFISGRCAAKGAFRVTHHQPWMGRLFQLLRIFAPPTTPHGSDTPVQSWVVEPDQWVRVIGGVKQLSVRWSKVRDDAVRENMVWLPVSVVYRVEIADSAAKHCGGQTVRLIPESTWIANMVEIPRYVFEAQAIMRTLPHGQSWWLDVESSLFGAPFVDYSGELFRAPMPSKDVD